MSKNKQTLQTISKYAIPLKVSHHKTQPRNVNKAYDSLLEAIGNSRVVLIGDASHGTKEFYRERAIITKRLIEEKNFTSVVIEGDWPDAYRVNRYVMSNKSKDKDANSALSDFKRFPTWMWRNVEFLNFVEWLKKHNARESEPVKQTGVYGMDLYCLHESAFAVINYLQKTDPEAAQRARTRYECFLQYGSDTQSYALATAYGLGKACEKEAVNTLKEVLQHSAKYLQTEGFVGQDEHFYAKESAQVVKDAENYYRTMMLPGPESWNVRDSHMVKIVNDLIEWKRSNDKDGGKVVVWAHNSHLGDARETDMGKKSGEHNVGQLIREKWREECFNIGFTTDHGTVSAATNWDDPRETKKVNPGRDDGYEGLFHEFSESSQEYKDFLLIFRKSIEEEGKLKKKEETQLVEALKGPMLERYIGVIYRPKTEKQSHYSKSSISRQFDAVIHIDETSALQPLDDRSGFPEEAEENLPELWSVVEPMGL